MCKPVIETVSHQINSQFSELSAHRLLSIFKMAEVQVVMLQVNSCNKTSNTIILLFLFPFVRWFMHLITFNSVT